MLNKSKDVPAFVTPKVGNRRSNIRFIPLLVCVQIAPAESQGSADLL